MHKDDSFIWKYLLYLSRTLTDKIRCSDDNEDMTESDDNSRGKISRDRIDGETLH